MNWMNDRKGSWTFFAGITCIGMVLFLVSSCGGPTPTSTLVPTDTPVPATTIASAPTIIPPQSYPTPILESPADGATITGMSLTKFCWRWEGDLQEDEQFDLQIWRSGKPCASISMQRECNCFLDTPPDGFGHYLWQVAVVRINESGNKSTLCESSIWPFDWIDVTPTPPPTDTPTPIPTATSTPTVAPTPIPKPDAVVKAEALNLRSGPGEVYDILAELKQGTSLKVTGRDPTDDWLKVTCPSGQEGWVARLLLQVNVDMAGVPVAEVPPAPTPVLLPAPILIAPEDGAAFIGGSVILEWQWVRDLEPDEIVSVRVRKEGETELCHHGQVHGFKYEGDLTYCSAGKHYWGVAVSRRLCTDCPEEEMWRKVSEPSAERWIEYVPESQWEATPSPPDDGGNGDGDDGGGDGGGTGGSEPPPG